MDLLNNAMIVWCAMNEKPVSIIAGKHLGVIEQMKVKLAKCAEFE